MRTITVTLDADDTAKTVTELASLTTKKDGISAIVIYAEPGNEDDVTNGPARVGGSDVDRVPADAGAGDDAVRNGFPLQPDTLNPDIFPYVGGGVYSFDHIYLTGKTGDVFQIHYITK